LGKPVFFSDDLEQKHEDLMKSMEQFDKENRYENKDA